MTVKVRQKKVHGKLRWEADIHVKLPCGKTVRDRKIVPNAQSRQAALRWGRSREVLLIRGDQDVRRADTPRKEATPTLKTFSPQFLRHCRATLKPSTAANHETNLRVHLIPAFGNVHVGDFERRHGLTIKGWDQVSPGTRNKILATLGSLLTFAYEFGARKTAPPTLRHMRKPLVRPDYFTHVEYDRLIACAAETGLRVKAMVLLGGEAGLRAGEARALRWRSVELARGDLHVDASEWNGIITEPKSKRYRTLPISDELAECLRELARRYPSKPRDFVLVRDDGRSISARWMAARMTKVLGTAGLHGRGRFHILRHTFCSHLAAAGVPIREIQELAGHSRVEHTERYMHLAPDATSNAIARLSTARRQARLVTGDVAETSFRSSESGAKSKS
ncbi:MAG: tyrosine-type recombinase/integrase [Myxococcales bacterium]|nr:tyrosine-type recombinase/integrase [Myxococcales bacterium]